MASANEWKKAVKISVDISMYPLDSNYVAPIKVFILRLRTFPGLEIVTNQLRGEFDRMTAASNACIRDSMAGEQKIVFVTRYLNADLEIGSPSQID